MAHLKKNEAIRDKATKPLGSSLWRRIISFFKRESGQGDTAPEDRSEGTQKVKVD